MLIFLSCESYLTSAVFFGAMAEKILDHSNGDVADNFYFRYKVRVRMVDNY